MDAFAGELPALRTLDGLTDDELRTIIERARTLLAARKSERQAQALAEIRRLAKEHGLDVQAKTRRRKRGRPRKALTEVV